MKLRLYALLTAGLLSSCGSYVATNSAGMPLADMRELPRHWHVDPMNNEDLARLERPRNFANYCMPYSIASLHVYDQPRCEREPIPFPEQENWRLLPVNNDVETKIGFAARAWLRTKSDKSQELVIAYRGTGETKDWTYGNLVPVFNGWTRNQYDAALDFAHRAIRECANDLDVVFTGHSLGGGLSEYAQKFISGSKSVSFDTSPNQGRLYSLFEPRQSERVAVRVYEKGEILSYLRFIMSPDLSREYTPNGPGVRATWMDFYKSGPMAGHDMHDLCTSLIKVSASTGNREALSVIEQIEMKWEITDLEPLRNPHNLHRKELRERILRQKLSQ